MSAAKAMDEYLVIAAELERRRRAGECVLPGKTEMITIRLSPEGERNLAACEAAFYRAGPITVGDIKKRNTQ